MDTRDLEALYPLSPLQQGMLFHSLDAPEEGFYVVQWRGRLTGALAPAVFRQAWQKLLDRHAALRVAILRQGVDQPLQIVYRQVEIPWRELDLRHLPPPGQQGEVAALARQERDRGFDFTRAPLMRLALVRTGDEAHELVWTFHHLLLDGWSLSVLLTELLALYEALVERREPDLPEPPRYRDYIAWLGRQDLGGAEIYWRGVLGGFREPLPLPHGMPRAVPRETAEHGPLDVQLPAGLAASLEQTAKRHQLTPNTLMLAALALLLGRATGRDDLVLGTVVSGRPASLPRVEAMVGLFVNTLPVRVRLATARATTRDWLRELQEQLADARRFEHCPLARVQQWSDVPPGQPLFDVLFAFESFPQAAALEDAPQERGGRLRLAVRSFAERLNYPLSLAVDPDRMALRLLHDGSRLDAATARRLLSHYENLLASLAAGMDRPLRELSALSPAERHQLVTEWNDSASAFPAGATIPEAFRRQVERHPDAEAVAFGDSRWTYRELEHRAAGLAARLRAAGVGPETLVGLCTERSASAIAGALAILLAGGAYVPLDPGNPQDRLTFMVRDAGLRVVLTQRPLAGRLEGLGVDLILLDEMAKGPAAGDTAAAGAAGPDALAYVIYTSGSTGTPKGVAIPHRGVVRLVLETNHARHEPGDRVAHVSSSSFDAATLEIWGALLNGATLVGLSQSDVLTPHLLARRLREERISVLSQPTALFNQVARAEPTAYAGLRHLFFGGETVDPQWPRQVVRRGGPERLIHIYGPTENTTLTTWHLVREVPEDAATIPIGRPISNSRVLLLDRDLEPVPIGVAGEMYLGGDGLARGYLGRPELTAERFVPDPWGGEPGGRLYKTGDLARYTPDGAMEFVGRLDLQVKLRGFRIELEEVEAALREHPAVEQCAALIREDVRGDRRLVAYVVGGREPLPGAGELRTFLKRSLPEYMVPSAFVPLAALPINPVGKVDRAALPAPEQLRPEGETPYATPRTPLETELARIWAQALCVDRVGVDDNFFELGGDSILAIQIVARAGEAGVRITSKQLFEHQSVTELARVAGAGPARRAAAGAGTDPVPLTPVQRSFFEGDPVDPHHFNQAVLLRTAPGLPARRLAAALRAVLLAHEALRYRFTRTADGAWEQRAGTAEGAPLTVVDLSALSADARTAALEPACAALQASLDLARGPLLRAALFHLDREREGRLLLAVHHLVVDTVSWGILLHDLEAACAQLGRGGEVRLPPPSTPFAHWARRLAAHASSAALRRELDVWLAGPWQRVRPLPTDLPDMGDGFGTVGSTRAVIRSLEEDETRELLQKTPAAFGVRIQEVLLAALTQTVAAWASGPVLVDLEGNGRVGLFDDVDLSRTVGWFTTVFPVLLDPPLHQGDEAAALRAVQESLRRLPFEGIGYGLLRSLSGDAEAAGRLRALPPAEIAFNYLGRSGEAPDGGLLSPAPEPPGPDGSLRAPRRHLLEVIALVRDGRLTVHWGYSARRHHAATVERLAAAFVEALRSLIARGREGEGLPLADAGFHELDSLLEEVSFGHE